MALFEPSFAEIGAMICPPYFAVIFIEIHGKTPQNGGLGRKFGVKVEICYTNPREFVAVAETRVLNHHS